MWTVPPHAVFVPSKLICKDQCVHIILKESRRERLLSDSIKLLVLKEPPTIKIMIKSHYSLSASTGQCGEQQLSASVSQGNDKSIAFLMCFEFYTANNHTLKGTVLTNLTLCLLTHTFILQKNTKGKFRKISRLGTIK